MHEEEGSERKEECLSHYSNPSRRFAENGHKHGSLGSDGAVVRDESRTIKGLAAIEEWKAETKKKYQHTIEHLASVKKDGKTVVTGWVNGNFPGSPIDLQFVFGVEADKIASLEIH